MLDLTPEYIEEANRLHWMVKGHLIPLHYSQEEIVSIYNSYTRRLWGNCEIYLREEGFADAWQKRLTSLRD